MKLKQEKWLLVLVIFCCSLCVNAQKKKAVPVKDTVPPAAKYVAIVEIDESSKIRVVFEDPYFLESYSNKTGWVENLFSSLNKKPLSAKPNFNEIIVKPNPALKYGEIVNVIEKIRKSSTQNIKVEISDDFLAGISKPLGNIVKPNPLFLVTRLDENGQVSLNNEEQGSINDLTKLKSFLRQIFKERADNGVLREGTNEVETTVFIKAPDSANFLEIVKIAQALREAGSSQIGLQIDEFVRTVRMEKID